MSEEVHETSPSSSKKCYNRFCVCLIRVKVGHLNYRYILDPLVTFPNPTKVSNAFSRCVDRAKLLAEELPRNQNLWQTMGLPAGELFSVKAVILEEPEQ